MISVDRVRVALLLLLHDSLADLPIGKASAIVQFCNVRKQLAIGVLWIALAVHAFSFPRRHFLSSFSFLEPHHKTVIRESGFNNFSHFQL